MPPAITLQIITSLKEASRNSPWDIHQLKGTLLSLINSLKVHKHEIFFLTFFAETETLWSQGPVTRDF
jgi:hypothetical protein